MCKQCAKAYSIPDENFILSEDVVLAMRVNEDLRQAGHLVSEEFEFYRHRTQRKGVKETLRACLLVGTMAFPLPVPKVVTYIAVRQ